MDVQDDPYNWSVDQVIAFFCQGPFASAFSQADIQSLATTLRENDISGDILLTEIDKNNLKEDLGIRSFGQRARINKTIIALRDRSLAYQQEHPRQHEPSTPLPNALSLHSSLHTPATVVNSPVLQHSVPPRLQTEVTAPREEILPPPPQLPPPRPLSPAELPSTRKHVDENAPRKKRRLDLSQLQTEKGDSRSRRRRYMPDRKFTLHDIFYGEGSDDSDDDVFVVEGNKASSGQRLFVKKALSRFFRQPSQIVKARDQVALARFPYKGQLMPENTKAFFTLFGVQDGKVVATKEALSDYPELDEGRENPFLNYLLKKYGADESEPPLPVYGDSGSEAEYDSDFINEIEEEQNGLGGAGESFGFLSSATIDEIVDEAIAKFEGKFKEKLPQYERKAFGVWRRSHRRNNVRDDIRRASNKIVHLTQRINDIRKKIHANQWTDTAQVIKQCEVLEYTVLDREDQKWIISVLEMKECPPRIDAPVAASVKKPKMREPDGDESLSSDGGLSEFIESDDEPAPSVNNVQTSVSTPARPKSPLSRAIPTKPRSPVLVPIPAPPESPPTAWTQPEENVPPAETHESPSIPEPSVPEVPVPEPLPIVMPDANLPPLPPPGDDDEDDIRLALQRFSRMKQPDTPKATPTLKLRPQPPAPPPSTQKQTPSKVLCSQLPSGADLIDLTIDDDDDDDDMPKDKPAPPPPAPSSNKDIPSDNRPQEAKPRSFIQTKLDGKPATEKPATEKPATIPISQPTSRQPSGSRKPFRASELPPITDVQAILRTPMASLRKQGDAARVLAHILYRLTSEQRSRLDEAFTANQKPRNLRDAIISASKDLKPVNPRRPIPRELTLHLLARCFASWVRNRDHVFGSKEVPSWCFEYVQCSRVKVKRFMKVALTCLDAAGSIPDPIIYSSGEEGSDEYEPSRPEPEGTPRSKKRKRKVAESLEASVTQRSARNRVKDQEEHQRRLAEKLERMGVSNEDPERQAVCFAPELYLHPHIGQRVKPHQLKGIQFMFRELVEDNRHQGALLAHTMGLGKTMQVISLLVTLAIAGGSVDKSVREHIPERLRTSRSLVLCPSSLIDNWYEECLMWIPQDEETQDLVGEVRKISSSLTPSQRIDTIFEWYQEGGILLLSYDIFREFIDNKAKRLHDSIHNCVSKQLLEGPNIIVADEAHKFKNRRSGLSIACAKFKSTSRIALTGSPLSNHLEDYYAMIDWIAPGYLGEFVQFKAKYMEPIEEGLYADSSTSQKRTSLKKLAVLKRDLDPKVQRADISAIAHDLPQKTEFVVTVPLTDLQKEAYNLYIESLVLNKVDDVASTNLWYWISVLSLLCNHPSCFMKKLQEKGSLPVPSESQAALTIDEQSTTISNDAQIIIDLEGGKTPISDIEEVSGAMTDIAVAQIPATATERLQKIFHSVPDIGSPAHSYRMLAVNLIIKQSIKLGDKVLIFSHSIPTLDYLECMLKDRVSYSRLDGKTPMGSRQAATKDFNMKDSTTSVYLISMKAGGLGLNIPGANRVIILDFGFNPSWEEQAVGRAYRLGQQKPVFVYRFMAGGTFETKIHNTAIFKTQLSTRVVDKRDLVSWATKSNKDYLFIVDDVPPMDNLHEYAGKDKILDVMLEQNLVRQLELTETFQKESDDKLTPEEQKDVEDQYADVQLMRSDYAAWVRKHELIVRRPDPPVPSLPLYPPTSVSAFTMPQPQFAPATIPMQQMNSVQGMIRSVPPLQQPAPPLQHEAPPLQPDMSATWSAAETAPASAGTVYLPFSVASANPPSYILSSHTHPDAPFLNSDFQGRPVENDVPTGNP